MMMNKKSNRTYLPRTDELTRTIEQLMVQQRQVRTRYCTTKHEINGLD